MNSAQSGTSGGERRLSAAASVRSVGNNSIFNRTSEEGYPLEDIPVADGFRPSNTAPEPETSTSHPGSSHEPTQPLLLSPLTRLTPPSQPDVSSSQTDTDDNTSRGITAPDVTNKGNPGPSISRPSSTSKLHRPHESFTLRNDGSSATITNSFNTSQSNGSPSSHAESPFHGSSSSSQQLGFLSDSSRTGPSRSGHLLADGEYNGPRGPAHPYALYPQNTAMSEELSSQHIPIGFPGHVVTYQRQVGPDGDEIGDLVGPLGHMEELPPYTRYPDRPYTTRDGLSAPVSSNHGTAGGDGSGSPSASPSVSSVPNPSADPSVELAATSLASASASASINGSGSPRNSEPLPTVWQTDGQGTGLAAPNPEYSPMEGVHGSNQSVETGGSVTTSQSFNIAAKDFADKIDMGGRWHRRARKKLWGVIPYWAICLLIIALVIVGIVLGAVVGAMMANNDGKRGDSEVEYPYGEVPTPADVEPMGALPSDLSPLIAGLFDLPPLEVSQAPRLCFNDTTQSQAWNCDMPLRWYSMEVGKIPNASLTENYEMTLTSVNGSDNMYLWGTQPPSIVDPVQLMLVNDTFEVSRGPAWWFKMNYNKQVILAESSFTSHQKREWEYDGPPRPGFDPTRFVSKNPGPQDGEKPWFCTWPNTTMEVFIYPSQNISVRYTSVSSSASDPSSTSAPQTTPIASYDPTPAYPHVIKFMERRLFMDGDEEAATCRQVRITNGGRDKEDLYDDDGQPIEVIIVERMRTYEELVEAVNRSRHPNRRWTPIEDNPLVKRESLELTDCGCLWWST